MCLTCPVPNFRFLDPLSLRLLLAFCPACSLQRRCTGDGCQCLCGSRFGSQGHKNKQEALDKCMQLLWTAQEACMCMQSYHWHRFMLRRFLVLHGPSNFCDLRPPMVKFVLIASDVHQSHLPESAAALGCTWSAQHVGVFFKMPPGTLQCNFGYVVCKWIWYSLHSISHLGCETMSCTNIFWRRICWTDACWRFSYSYTKWPSVVMWSAYTDLNQHMIIYIVWYTNHVFT